MQILDLIFYVFAATAIFAATMVVASNNPVRSALYLVLAFFNAAGMWMLTQAEFLSLILVLVYVGAVMTLFLFVIMMININTATVKQNFVRYLPFGLMVMALLVALMFISIRPEHFLFEHLSKAKLHGVDYSNTKELGSVLYTNYAYPFILAAVLLLVAIVSAISLAFRGPQNCKTQNTPDQIKVKREDRVRLVKMKADKSYNK